METEYLYISATLPWLSTDAKEAVRRFSKKEQQDIDRCLSCQHSASCCDRCDGRGNVRMREDKYDPALLREMLRLRVCKKEAARRMGISRRTLYTYMARMEKERH